MHLFMFFILSTSLCFSGVLGQRYKGGYSVFNLQPTFSADGIGNNYTQSIIASLREYPSEAHLCSASFVRKDALVTTASCIFGRIPGKYFVHTLSRLIGEGGVSAEVASFYPHPYYETDVNDIGLIVLKQPIPQAMVHYLPLAWSSLKGQVLFYEWQFAQNQLNYTLHENKANLINNGLCTLVFIKYVECKYICIAAPNIHQGSADMGVPLSGRINNIVYILGFYNKIGTQRYSSVEVYEKIYPYVSWIRRMLNLTNIPLQQNEFPNMDPKPII